MNKSYKMKIQSMNMRNVDVFLHGNNSDWIVVVSMLCQRSFSSRKDFT